MFLCSFSNFVNEYRLYSQSKHENRTQLLKKKKNTLDSKYVLSMKRLTSNIRLQMVKNEIIFCKDLLVLVTIVACMRKSQMYQHTKHMFLESYVNMNTFYKTLSKYMKQSMMEL